MSDRKPLARPGLQPARPLGSAPDLLEAARAQLTDLTLTSRAFYNDQLGPFAAALANLAAWSAVARVILNLEAAMTKE